MTSTIPKLWSKGTTCFLIAGGPSLHGFDPSIISSYHSIVINNSYSLHPTADYLYFCDSAWYQQHRKTISSTFRGQGIITISRLSGVGDSNILQIRNMGKNGLNLTNDGICHGSHSGYQVINLSVLMGATQLILLGYDLRIWTWGDAADPSSYISITSQSEEQIERATSHISSKPELYNLPFGTHWHRGHGAPAEAMAKRLREVMLPPMATLVQPLQEQGVEVINCTPKSAVTHWPFRRLEDVLEGMSTGVRSEEVLKVPVDGVPVESIGSVVGAGTNVGV